MRNPSLLARVFGTPHLIESGAGSAIAAGLLASGRFGFDAAQVNLFDINGGFARALNPSMFVTEPGQQRTDNGYHAVDGVAMVNIFGVLTHRGEMDAACNYFQGYQDIIRLYAAALADPTVRAIAGIFSTPGGDTEGAFTAAEQIFQWRGQKPLWAIVDEKALSAGQLLAAAHDRTVVTATGMLGSVGVKMMHLDLSKKLAADGLSVTEIFSGQRKIDGSQFGPLTEEVKARYQAIADELRGRFAAAVAQYRGLDVAAVLAQEAAIYRGEDAIKQGLADQISTPDAAIAELRRAAFSSTSSRGFTRMTAITDQPSASAQDLERMKAEAKAEGYKAGQADERARTQAIMGHEHAKGREATALALCATDMGAEDAAKLLATVPAAAPPQAAGPDNQFVAHMNALGNPQVAPAGGQPESGSPAAIAAEIKSAWDYAATQNSAFNH